MVSKLPEFLLGAVLLLKPLAQSAGFVGQICYNDPWRAVVHLVSKSEAKQGNGLTMHRPDGDRSTPQVLKRPGAASDRLVCFDYCISLLLVTLRRTSNVYRLRPG